MQPVHHRAVRARSLARRRIPVRPLPAQPFRERCAIVGAERRHGANHERGRLVRRERARAIVDEGNVEVLVAQALDTQHPLPQREIPVQRRQMPMRVPDELRVHVDGDVVAEKRGLQRRSVFAGGSLERVRLDLRVQRRSERARELAVRGPERLEYLRAVVAVQRLAMLFILAFVEQHFLPVRQRHHGPRQVGIGEDRPYRLAGIRDQAGLGEQLLALCVERVRRVPQRVVKRVAPGREPRIGADECAHLRGTERQYGRPDPGRGGGERDDRLAGLLVHLLTATVPRVEVVAHARIDRKTRPALADPIAQRKRGNKLTCGPESLRLRRREPDDIAEELHARLVPGRLVCVDFGEIPLVPVVDRRAVLGGNCRAEHGGGCGEHGLPAACRSPTLRRLRGAHFNLGWR